MGGIIILAAVVITSLFYVKDYPKIIPVLFLTVGFGLIGFLDDYLKVVMKRSDGLFPMQKMALQIVVTAIFAFYIVKVAKIPLTMIVPFSGGYELNLGWFAIPVLFFAVIGTVNGTNFTDGLDGLASSVTVLVATFFTVVAIGTKSGIEPITCAVVGALMGFLLFNVYPAYSIAVIIVKSAGTLYFFPKKYTFTIFSICGYQSFLNTHSVIHQFHQNGIPVHPCRHILNRYYSVHIFRFRISYEVPMLYKPVLL